MSKLYAGFDIGGTSVRLKVYDEMSESFVCSEKSSFKRCDSAGAEVEENICSLLEDSLKENNLDIKDLKGIGLSLAANFSRETGDIVLWPNNRLWDGYRLRAHLNSRYNVPIAMEDDANCAALGEFVYGSARGFKDFAYVTVSTGIGCGLVLNGNLYVGSNGWAGELGHIKVKDGGPLCKCGSTGCLQALASGPAMLGRSKELAEELGIDTSGFNSLEDILSYGQEAWVKRSFDEAAEYLSDSMLLLIMLMDISLIVVGGGVTKAGEQFLNPFDTKLKQKIQTKGRQVSLRLAALEDDNGVIGAANTIYKYINKNCDIIIKD